MKTKEEYKKFIKDGYEVERKARLEICKLLNEHGPIEFDWENSDAPSICSMQFRDDVADCYVKALEVEGDTLYADLHAYYLGEDLDGTDILNSEAVEWCSLLDAIRPYLFDEKIEK
jgi:hypothetical protein